jgi:hypothetical protein
MARPGLRLKDRQRKDLMEEFQLARGNKDLDMCLRIQALLLVSQGNREIDAANMIGVGRPPFKTGFTDSAAEVFRDWEKVFSKAENRGLPTPRKPSYRGSSKRDHKRSISTLAFGRLRLLRNS